MKLQISHRNVPLITQHIDSLEDTALLNVSELCRKLSLSRQLFCQYVEAYGFDGAVAKALDRRAAKAKPVQ